jgi:hypothetical protein
LSDQTKNGQQYDGAYGGSDDLRDHGRADVDVPSKQIVTDQGADQSDDNVSKQTKAATLDDQRCQSTRNGADHYRDKQTSVHGVTRLGFLGLGTAPTDPLM